MDEAWQQQSWHTGRPDGTDLMLGNSLQGQIGIQLRAVFETLVTDTVPPRFSELLDRLDARTYN